MARKSWQPSHEPACNKRSLHLSHCWDSGKREGKGWEGNCLGDELPHYQMPPKNASCTFTRLQSTSKWNSNTCANVSTPLTTRETQPLFVVNSVKLHLTAFKRWMMRRQELSPRSQKNERSHSYCHIMPFIKSLEVWQKTWSAMFETSQYVPYNTVP